MATHLAAIALLLLVLAAWVAVQNAWRRTFPGACSDPDVLAGRRSCRLACPSTRNRICEEEHP